ncbi:hypothetical protein [Streptomyces sp. NBC_01361]|uniref:hypothetical protein n=1 Tax=Streptomyces sp. NBC_01361 TaxID=2903838 RepID=UPI002E33BF0A|nr:hypothetical protein [Streptomyces sp. NBC_01361]
MPSPRGRCRASGGRLCPGDWDGGTLTTLRAGIWLTLAAAVFTVLLPPRVTAGVALGCALAVCGMATLVDGWLAVDGLVRLRRVRTDALVGPLRFI